jgi:hydrogenase-4 component B
VAASLTLVCAGATAAACSGLPTIVVAAPPKLAHGLAAALALLGSALGLIGALLAAFGGETVTATAPWPVPGGSLAIAIDGLSALFLLPVFLVPACAALYGLGYAPPGSHHGAGVRLFQGLLTAGMVVLVIARNSVLFLVGWEVMALAAWLLIATDHTKAATRQAAWIYLVATHLGTACLIAAFALLQLPDGSLDWSPAVFSTLPAARALCVFGLALLGFGLKAGLMPLHVWLPAAHSNAPSHVSAVLSGVMIKMGVYGLLRMLALLPALPSWCSALLLALGALSALLGAAAALGQVDIKRLLAYSSIENIGIVFLGIGLFALGRSLGSRELAVLGLAGALLHVLNHSLFKPLLFLGAGSLINATGTRNMDALGGLLGRMPHTGRCFLVGAGAICGLPMLNGFIGEFALYLGLFRAATSTTSWLALLAAAAMAALAMVGGLAVIAFVRSAAAIFLGHARSAPAAKAQESPATMLAPMFVLAGLCAVFGLLPWLLLPLLAAVLGSTFALPAPGDLLPFGLLSAIAVSCAAAMALLLPWLRRRRQPVAQPVGTWDCGYVDASSPRLQYTGSSFAQFAVQLLGWTVKDRAAAPARLELFPGPRTFMHRTVETLLHGFLWPICRRLADRCSRLRFLQHGKLQLYLLYILIVLVLLLCWSAASTWSRQ